MSKVKIKKAYLILLLSFDKFFIFVIFGHGINRKLPHLYSHEQTCIKRLDKKNIM